MAFVFSIERRLLCDDRRSSVAKRLWCSRANTLVLRLDVHSDISFAWRHADNRRLRPTADNSGFRSEDRFKLKAAAQVWLSRR
jgi:hypothetical protein